MGKCNILHLGKNNPNHKYKLTSEGDVVELVEIEEEKDLEIKFDSLLSFKQHTCECVSKANQRLGLKGCPHWMRMRHVTEWIRDVNLSNSVLLHDLGHTGYVTGPTR